MHLHSLRRLIPNEFVLFLTQAAFSVFGHFAIAHTTWKIDQAQLEIRIGYTLGTHKLLASTIRGNLIQAEDSFASVSGRLVVPIHEIKEGNPKLECHLQSSLGLDYSISQFPAEHVCDSDNQLPKSGPNSVAFPEIELVIEKLERISDKEYEVDGQWTIHGVSRPASQLRIKLETNGDKVVSSGEYQFKLSDHGIVVKRAFVISAADTAMVKWTASFKKSEERAKSP
jgi:polyisoprenoid-binding protein YceI